MTAWTIGLVIALALLPASLSAEVKVGVGYYRAEALALSLVPGGTVVSGSLERENGALVWLFDVSIQGSRNLKEIQVDARTGAIVSNTLVGPTDR